MEGLFCITFMSVRGFLFITQMKKLRSQQLLFLLFLGSCQDMGLFQTLELTLRFVVVVVVVVVVIFDIK